MKTTVERVLNTKGSLSIFFYPIRFPHATKPPPRHTHQESQGSLACRVHVCASLSWHKQRFDVVFCVWRAFRWPESGLRHDLVALIAGYSYLITGFVGPSRGPVPGPLHARAKMRVHLYGKNT